MAGTNVYGQLVKAQLEQLSSDPTGYDGRIYFNTSTKKVRFYDGTVWDNLVTGSNTTPAGAISAFGGSVVSPPTGWFVCDGTEISKTTYAELFSAIGTAWDTCEKQDGSGATWASPSAGNFRLPDLRGVFLRSVGTSSRKDGSGDTTVTLAAMLDDTTAKNGLTASAASSSVSGTVGGSDGTHGHTLSARQTDTTGTGYISDCANAGTPDFNCESSVTSTGSGHGHGFSLTAAAQTITIGAGDTETAPRSVGVNYIIKY